MAADHLQLPPVMLLGEPGPGKTWYLTRLGEALGLPVRTYAMAAASLSEGLQGAQPSWRNAGPGLVARTLLQEAGSRTHTVPFHALLEPSGSRRCLDECLQFETDASAISRVLAGNDPAPLPEPVRDRLTVIEVPPMSEAHVTAVVASIYAEANAVENGFFGPEIEPDVLGRLLTLSPRGIRKDLDDALVRAAS